MPAQTFIFVPRKAWPALTQFAPERFPQLQLEFDTLESGSERMKLVRAELEALVHDFRTWAAGFLRTQRHAELIAAGQQVQIQRKLDQSYWAKHFAALDNVDLTITERERLHRHRMRHVGQPAKSVEDALKALEKPWKYRASKLPEHP